jgi:hypothetical protein
VDTATLGRRQSDPVESARAKFDDVVGEAGEHPSRVFVALHLSCHSSGRPVGDTTAVRVEGPAKEVQWVLGDDLVLATLQDDAALVLPSLTVLRKQTRPVFPSNHGHQAAGTTRVWGRLCGFTVRIRLEMCAFRIG